MPDRDPEGRPSRRDRGGAQALRRSLRFRGGRRHARIAARHRAARSGLRRPLQRRQVEPGERAHRPHARWRAPRPIPGHTRQINFFNLAGKLYLVDLPGYGFAQVSRSMKETWQDLASAYLRGRPTLKRVCVLIDSRHGVKDSDRETMKNLDSAAVSYQLVLTKTDYLKKADIPRAIAAAEAVARKHGAAHPDVLPTSSETGFGIRRAARRTHRGRCRLIFTPRRGR